MHRSPSAEESATAERVGELLGALYFQPGEHPLEPGARERASLEAQNMLEKVGLRAESFGKKWPSVFSRVERHAQKVCRRRPKCKVCPLVSFCAQGQQNVAKDPRPVVVDLFAGAGGLGRGFYDAGFRVGLAIELDRDAAQTYRLNNPGTPVIEKDVRKVNAREITRLVRAPVSVVCAGPPCQSFSAAGPRQACDPRHGLFRYVLDIAHDLGPDVVVIENVPGIARTVTRRQSYKEIVAKELGRRYKVEILLLNAANYGVPQVRNRYIFVGTARETGLIGVPKPTHSMTGERNLPKTATVLQSLREIPVRPAASKQDWHRFRSGMYLRNLTTMTHSQKVIRKIASIRGGEGPISYRRVPITFARTLISGHRALPVHPRLNRTISVREAACIQSFPLDYVFLGKPANQPLQVANAVPPLMARALAKSILAHIRKKQTST